MLSCCLKFFFNFTFFSGPYHLWLPAQQSRVKRIHNNQVIQHQFDFHFYHRIDHFDNSWSIYWSSWYCWCWSSWFSYLITYVIDNTNLKDNVDTGYCCLKILMMMMINICRTNFVTLVYKTDSWGARDVGFTLIITAFKVGLTCIMLFYIENMYVSVEIK